MFLGVFLYHCCKLNTFPVSYLAFSHDLSTTVQKRLKYTDHKKGLVDTLVGTRFFRYFYSQ